MNTNLNRMRIGRLHCHIKAEHSEKQQKTIRILVEKNVILRYIHSFTITLRYTYIRTRA